jgi:hypothetical protein
MQPLLSSTEFNFHQNSILVAHVPDGDLGAKYGAERNPRRCRIYGKKLADSAQKLKMIGGLMTRGSSDGKKYTKYGDIRTKSAAGEKWPLDHDVTFTTKSPYRRLTAVPSGPTSTCHGHRYSKSAPS